MKRKTVKKKSNILYFIYFVLVAALVVFSIFLIQKKTNDIREQKAAAAGLNLKVATDPNFPEYLGEIVTGFPEDFPLFPGAVLVGSALSNPADAKIAGYRVKWDAAKDKSTIEIIDWYKKELGGQGWEMDNPEVWEGMSELILHIKRDNLIGYIAAEYEENAVEIVADLKIQ